MVDLATTSVVIGHYYKSCYDVNGTIGGGCPLPYMYLTLFLLQLHLTLIAMQVMSMTNGISLVGKFS